MGKFNADLGKKLNQQGHINISNLSVIKFIKKCHFYEFLKNFLKINFNLIILNLKNNHIFYFQMTLTTFL